MIEDLSRDRGKTWATEKGFVKELQRRTGGLECSLGDCDCHAKGGRLHGGYRMGDGTFRKVRLRLQRKGIVGHERIKPGRTMVHGKSYDWGGQHNWLTTREEQRKARRLAREEARQERDRRKRRLEEAKRADELRAMEARAATVLASRSALLVTNPPADLSFTLPADLFAMTVPKDDTAERVARHRDELARQLAAARALADDWADQDKPPD